MTRVGMGAAERNRWRRRVGDWRVEGTTEETTWVALARQRGHCGWSKRCSVEGRTPVAAVGHDPLMLFHNRHSCPLLFHASSPPTLSPLACGRHPSPPLCRAPLPPPATSPLPRQRHLSCLLGRTFDSPVTHSTASSGSLPSCALPRPAPNHVVPPPRSPPLCHYHRSLPLGRAQASSRVVPLRATVPCVLSSSVRRRHLRRLLRPAFATEVLPSTEHRCDHQHRPLFCANATHVVSSIAPSTLQSPTRWRRRFCSAAPVPTRIVLSARPASSAVHSYRVNPLW